MNFKIRDIVVYGGSGVCEIEDIKDISFCRERPQKYYVLRPLFDSQALVVYVPFDNEKLKAKMQPVISREEAMELIEGMNDYRCEWIEDRNLRKETYSDMLAGGERRDIIAVITAINGQYRRLSDEGKSLNIQDEKLLTEAKKRMDAEFAVSLNIEIGEVEDFIHSHRADCAM